VRLPYYAIICRDLHQQPHDHELQLPYKYTDAPYPREQERVVAVIEPERQTVGVR
jgi:hypothetical protein